MCVFFFFNDTATTEIYTLSLHDALPICMAVRRGDHNMRHGDAGDFAELRAGVRGDVKGDAHEIAECKSEFLAALLKQDRKSTRLNSSHSQISYAVFCLKKKKKKNGHIDVSQSEEERTVVLTTASVSELEKYDRRVIYMRVSLDMCKRLCEDCSALITVE